MATALTLEQLGDTAIVTLDNPPANQWDSSALAGLSETLTRLASNQQIRSVVLTGAGDQFFSAGADLKVFRQGGPTQVRELLGEFTRALAALRSFPGVTVAAINGVALGGGLECALACDYIVAEQGAVFGMPETRVGLVPCAGGTKVLTDRVGMAWAKRIILGGEQVDANKARDIGLVEEVAAIGLAKITAVSLANRVTQQGPQAVRTARHLIQQGAHQDFDAQLRTEQQALLELLGSEEQREGVEAFFAKRPPYWQEDED